MEDQTLISKIQNLPQELRTKIYKEYFETRILYDTLKNIINSDECKALYNIDLGKFLEKYLSNPQFLSYLREHEKEFNVIYENEIVAKKITNIDYYNLASLWLFNLYFIDILRSPRSMVIRTNLFNNLSM